jgi:hypothetical protein
MPGVTVILKLKASHGVGGGVNTYNIKRQLHEPDAAAAPSLTMRHHAVVKLDAPCTSVLMTPLQLLLGTANTVTVHALRPLLSAAHAGQPPPPAAVVPLGRRKQIAEDIDDGEAASNTDDAACVRTMLPFLPGSVLVLDSTRRLHVLRLPERDSPNDCSAPQPYAAVLVRAHRLLQLPSSPLPNA